jgi:hypothetical protein
MPLPTANLFAPLADHDEEEQQMDNGSPPLATENFEGWTYDLTVSSNDSQLGSTSHDVQDKKPSAKKKLLKTKKKNKNK